MSIRELNEQFNKGILPDELNFGIQKEFVLDINKIKYNAFYRSYDFYESKFPKGYESIPGFDNIISYMAKKADDKKKSPLDELEQLEKDIKLLEQEINNNIE